MINHKKKERDSVVVGARIPKSFQRQIQKFMAEHGYVTPSELLRTALREKMERSR